MSDSSQKRETASTELRMPARVRGIVYLLASLAFAGGLYLIAVRGDVLLADLSALVTLICG